MPGQCPKCGAAVTAVTAQHVTVAVPLGESWHGISHSCPVCNVILSVQIDPIAIKTDIIEGLLQELRRR